MTSDAKIGLLLGLIFIFIIAFILNGLPGLHGKGGSNQATAEDLSNLSTSTTETGLAPVAGVASDMGAPAGKEDVRYKISLGGAKSGDAGVAAAADAKDALCAADSNCPAPKASADAKSSVVDLTSPAKPVDAVTTTDVAASGTEAPVADAPKTSDYTIASGDSPAKIAIKTYGPKEGVKPANISRIMAANQIKDPTKLVVGKKLTIPALPTGPEKLAVTNPDSFSKVEKTLVPAPKSDVKATTDAKTETKTLAPKVIDSDPAPKAAPKVGKEYTVTTGDSLWKIASKTLGDGNRYKEIVKLNSGKLGKDGTRLAVGMKLQIPAK